MTDDTSATANSVTIDPFQFQPGEAAEVGTGDCRPAERGT